MVFREVVLVTVVLVGIVLARRGFSASGFLAERTRPVLIVGAAFRGDGDERVRRLSVGISLTGVTSALPRRRSARSSNCTKLKIQQIKLKDVNLIDHTRNITNAPTVSMRITNG